MRVHAHTCPHHTPHTHPGGGRLPHGGIQATTGQFSLGKQTRVGWDKEGETADIGGSSPSLFGNESR